MVNTNMVKSRVRREVFQSANLERFKCDVHSGMQSFAQPTRRIAGNMKQKVDERWTLYVH